MGSAPAPTSRLAFIDNLRTLIIVLVILVHLSITYGGEGGWYYKEVKPDLPTGLILTFHNATCQSFFMGCMFLLSGYFTPASFDRKGPRRFLIDRLVRLGIPMLFYDLAIHPFLIYWLARHGVYQLSFRQWAASYYTSFHLGRGPLWFVEALLLFGLVYLIWRLANNKPALQPASDRESPGGRSLIVLALFLGVTSFLVRLWRPVGWSYEPLNFQLPYFPQYIVMFILGVQAYRRQWLTRLSATLGRTSLVLAAVFVFVLFPLLVILGGATKGDVSPFTGGLHWQALALALWEQSLGVLLMVGLVVLFRERLNRHNRLSQAASANSFATYVLHTPVLIVLTLMAREIRLYPLLKFAAVAVVVVPACFLVATLIRQLPGLKRVL
jgi:surface polysaccharide O-acyltransferase-like enzyme